MRLYRETTDWTTPNHTYLLTDNKQYMHGYIKSGRADVEMFKSPIRFDTRGRTFQFISEYDKNTPAESDVVITVLGSKRDKYYVKMTDDAAECSCTGFKYRGECKHIAIAREAVIYT